jgi:hypothetical protein
MRLDRYWFLIMALLIAGPSIQAKTQPRHEELGEVWKEVRSRQKDYVLTLKQDLYAEIIDRGRRDFVRSSNDITNPNIMTFEDAQAGHSLRDKLTGASTNLVDIPAGCRVSIKRVTAGSFPARLDLQLRTRVILVSAAQIKNHLPELSPAARLFWEETLKRVPPAEPYFQLRGSQLNLPLLAVEQDVLHDARFVYCPSGDYRPEEHEVIGLVGRPKKEDVELGLYFSNASDSSYRSQLEIMWALFFEEAVFPPSSASPQDP